MKNFKNYAIILFASLIMASCTDMCEELPKQIEKKEKSLEDWEKLKTTRINEKERSDNPEFINRHIELIEQEMRKNQESIQAFTESYDCNCK